MIAGKQCLLRIFLEPAIIREVQVIYVWISRAIVEPFFRPPPVLLAIPRDYLIIEESIPNGPSIGIVMKGQLFPEAVNLNYSIKIRAVGPRGRNLHELTTDYLKFHPTKDLRLLVVPIDMSRDNYAYKPQLSWPIDIAMSMLRLGSIFPVRDGVQSELNGIITNGIRYRVGPACGGTAGENFTQCAYEQTRSINRSPGDDIDVTIEYRPGFYIPNFYPLGDICPGGRADYAEAPYNDLRRVQIVVGYYPAIFDSTFPCPVALGIPSGIETTAPIMAQEIGHHFGLEPDTSPHSDGRGHSKDKIIFDQYAFDFRKIKPRHPVPEGWHLGDLMSTAWDQGADRCLLNVYDWEYMRSQLMLLNSTGTDAPTITPVRYSKSDDFVIIEMPSQSGLSTLQESMERVLTKTSGYTWEWTSGGIWSVPSANNNKSAISEEIYRIISDLQNEGSEHIYIPIQGKKFDMIVNQRTDYLPESLLGKE